MKAECEMRMNPTEMSILRQMYEIKLNERKKSEELRELLGLDLCSQFYDQKME